jgi:hypothetical protein
MSLLPIVQALEEHQIKATFWSGKDNSVTGVPKYLGFDPDVGHGIEVDGKPLAMHDFRSLILVNPDNPVYQEHYDRPS